MRLKDKLRYKAFNSSSLLDAKARGKSQARPWPLLVGIRIAAGGGCEGLTADAIQNDIYLTTDS
jgi:hypothetical protein